MNSEALQTFAWPMAVVLIVLILGLLFRKQLASVIENKDVRVKRGDTELEVRRPVEATIVPITPVEGQTVSQPPSEEQAEKKEEEREQLLGPEPKSSAKLASEMFLALSSGDFELGEQKYEELQNLEKDRIQKLRNEAYYYYLRFLRGDTSALTKLQDLARQPDASAIAHYRIGMCFDQVDNYDRASMAYELAVRDATEPSTRAAAVAAAANSLFKAGKEEQAFVRIGKELAKTTVPQAISRLYEGLANLYEMKGNHELRALALDKALENDPNNTRLRFDAAYAFGEDNMHHLALLHYEILLRFNPKHEAALNNIGVAYEALKMPIHSTESYKKSVELGNTLASSNLAFKFMQGGLAQEALEILNEAKSRQNVNPNVGTAVARLASMKEAETEAEESAQDLARRLRRFYLEFATAFFVETSDIPNFGSSWLSGEGIEMRVTQTNGQIEAEWKEGNKPRKLAGVINNRAALVTTFTEKYDFSTNTSKLAPDGGIGRVYLSGDGQRLFIILKKENEYDRFKGNEYVFLTFDRATPS
ncbi:MAG: tetratricopeptide repeat protein [Chloroflexi bacterium]|nr:tetratricopeptide repeat protein [Chloroflexota bacterium]MCI0574673.1 tetratricopeptide repeat protein [Chloroflexota bacterium]MCI0649045.1 tetratricopeptide repeat protein [Chloroflexota bacterium]MCI0725162.1 tetratricopeptide repeat protein [Chloroflexota bacterium]